MKFAVLKILLIVVPFFVSLDASAEPKSYFQQYCPTHQSDKYCQLFADEIRSSDKRRCCEQVSEEENLVTAYAPGWYARRFGYPLELFDRCMLGPVAGVVFCE